MQPPPYSAGDAPLLILIDKNGNTGYGTYPKGFNRYFCGNPMVDTRNIVKWKRPNDKEKKRFEQLNKRLTHEANHTRQHTEQIELLPNNQH